jgi:type II secretory ATPase GspE/PulE/Tfp pilus assembly ATPase PilB-like protein
LKRSSATQKKSATEPPLGKRLPLEEIEAALHEQLERKNDGVSGAVDLLLEQAVRHEASDIHIVPQPEFLAVRFRIDGIVYDTARIARAFELPITVRLKVMAGMILYQKSTPQDGRIDPDETWCNRALRVATFPSINGESVTLRVTGSSLDKLSLTRLGFHGRIAKRLRGILARPQGAFLLTGPSSSGKTTTIYALLNEMTGKSDFTVRKSTPHVVTIEDPIEYALNHATQTELDTRAGFTYKEALRNVLRQDPDVIFVGEIRDANTAQAAIQAGLTGHLVISTIHSGSAAGVYTRLLGMGIEPYLVASSVTSVLSQRLVRRNCADCSAPYDPDAALMERFGVDKDINAQRGTGCDQCEGLGYRGRTSIAELLASDEVITDLVTQRAPTHAIREAAKQCGMISILTHALQKVKRGKTTLEELDRVLAVDKT